MNGIQTDTAVLVLFVWGRDWIDAYYKTGRHGIVRHRVYIWKEDR